MSLKDLAAVVTPPDSPLEIDESNWETAQQELGLTLPADYKEMGATYGNGQFKSDVFTIEWLNPLSASFVEDARECAIYLEARRVESPKKFPYSVFPDPGGLFPWGSDDIDNEFCWLTEGESENWPIVVCGEDDTFVQFDLPITEFLARALNFDIKIDVWPGIETSFQFEPVEKPKEKVWPSNIYELYVQNGNQAGFWVHETMTEELVTVFIRSIDGQESGKLSGIPNEYGRPEVKADLYVKGQRFEENTDMSHAFHQAFVRVDPPNEIKN